MILLIVYTTVYCTAYYTLLSGYWEILLRHFGTVCAEDNVNQSQILCAHMLLSNKTDSDSSHQSLGNKTNKPIYNLSVALTQELSDSDWQETLWSDVWCHSGPEMFCSHVNVTPQCSISFYGSDDSNSKI